jgi:hypothetical protein
LTNSRLAATYQTRNGGFYYSEKYLYARRCHAIETTSELAMLN